MVTREAAPPPTTRSAMPLFQAKPSRTNASDKGSSLSADV